MRICTFCCRARCALSGVSVGNRHLTGLPSDIAFPDPLRRLPPIVNLHALPFFSARSWLIALAFFLAGGFIKSGLGNRIAYGESLTVVATYS